MNEMIYCVEDDRNIRELLVYTLETTGFSAKGIEDGKELWTQLKKEIPDMILLDIMLPGEDGYRILQKLKESPATKEIPVIMVTAKEAEYDKVRGLEAGADDYITKPFGMMEFVARVKAVLRRSSKRSGERELKCGELCIHAGRHEVLYQEKKVELTRKEFELLMYLLENKNLVMTRNQILCHVWGYDFDGETRTVDVHVRTIRQKLGSGGNLIETVRGVGYRIGEKQK
jgi:two-component system alkaline phosphatase synthesis response regulator PhoP